MICFGHFRGKGAFWQFYRFLDILVILEISREFGSF